MIIKLREFQLGSREGDNLNTRAGIVTLAG